MYSSIEINSLSISGFKLKSESSSLDGLQKINIFIGSNNSGKSRFLRALFFETKIKFLPLSLTSKDLEIYNETIRAYKKSIQRIYHKQGVTSINEIKLDELGPLINCSIENNFGINSINSLKRHSSIKSGMVYGKGNHNTGVLFGEIREASDLALSELKEIEFKLKEIRVKDTVYFPTLRGLRGVDFDNENGLGPKDNYLIRTKLDYFKQTDADDDLKLNDKIYTGQSLYEDVKRMLLGATESRKKIRDFERFISETFFDGNEFNIIPHIDDNVVHVKIGALEEFPVYNLGDGIQSIIILTYPLFFNIGKTMNFYFEEPDLYLHPGYQRIFLQTLLKEEFKSFQFYLTTHSNHFLDMTIDSDQIAVYSFQKINNEYLIENVKSKDKNLLEILGVRNSSVFLTNCTIWVEGISDRIYIRKYLELLQVEKGKKYLEDVHYSFIEYGGGNITHWSFLEDKDEVANINVDSLCGKLFLIADLDSSESSKNGGQTEKQKRLEKIRENLNDRCFILTVREIENLLTAEVLIEIVKEFEVDKESLKFDQLKFDDYKMEYLGKYLSEKVVGLKRKYYSPGGSGTIKDKVKFAKCAVSKMQTYDQLSEEAKKLTQSIYDFIKLNN